MSKWTYVLAFDDEFMTADEAKYFLNARDDVFEWAHVFDNVYLIVSSTAANALGDRLFEYVKKNQNREKPNGRFLLSEPTGDRNGWLPQVGWNLLDYKSLTKPEAGNEIEDEITF